MNEEQLEFKDGGSETVEVEESITPQETEQEKTGSQDESGDELSPQADTEPRPYTDEEAAEILEHGGELDSKRLTAAQKLIQKSFDKHFTRRFQEAADARRAYEAKLAETSSPKNIYQAFDRDPVGVMQEVRQLLYKKKAEDPFSDETLKLEALRDDLLTYSMRQTEMSKRVNDVVTRNDSIIKNAIPDFNREKSAELTKFAMEQFGLSNEELAYLTNNAHGEVAAKVTIFINDLYKKMNAGKTADKKAVKTPPAPLGRAGESSKGEIKSLINFQTMPDDKFEEMLNKVKFGGAKLKI